MLAYVLLICVPILFLFICRNHENRHKIDIGIGVEYIQKENYALPVFFLCFFAMLALRDETIGRDLLVYKLYFEEYKKISFAELLYSQSIMRLDTGFMIVDWLVGKITDSYQVYIAIIAAITLIPMVILYCEDKAFSYLKILLFVNMTTFVMMFSGLRQSVAIGGACWAYMYVRKKDWKKFLVVAFLMLTMHHSAFMIFLLYPIYHCKIRKKHLFIVVPVIMFILLFNRQIFGIASGILMKYSDKYDAAISSTGAYTMLVLFGMFFVFAFLIPDESKMTSEEFGLRNILIMTVMLQCFAPIYATAMRLNYYFIIFIPIAIPKMINKTSKRFEQVASLANVVLTLFFAFYFLNSTYTSYLTGISDLDTIPYVPFWKR